MVICQNSHRCNARKSKGEKEGYSPVLDDTWSLEAKQGTRGGKTNSINGIIEPFEERERIASDSSQKAADKEKLPKVWMALKTVVNNSANAGANEPAQIDKPRLLK
jgi:hypothetical protein